MQIKIKLIMECINLNNKKLSNDIAASSIYKYWYKNSQCINIKLIIKVL